MPEAIARPDTRKYEDQRRLLLELVADPPTGGESVAASAAQRGAVGAAGRALERACLAESGPDGLRASSEALGFDALWPAAL